MRSEISTALPRATSLLSFDAAKSVKSYMLFWDNNEYLLTIYLNAVCTNISLLKKITVQCFTHCLLLPLQPPPTQRMQVDIHSHTGVACSLQLPYSALTPEAGYIRPRPRSRPSLSVSVRLGPVHVALNSVASVIVLTYVLTISSSLLVCCDYTTPLQGEFFIIIFMFRKYKTLYG